MLHRKRQRRAFGTIAELPLVLFILFCLILLPSINLLALGAASSAACLLAHQEASQAAVQVNYRRALAEVQREADGLCRSGFARLLKLTPVSGYMGCGSDLYVQATNYNTGAISLSGANQPPSVVDTSSNVYEYMVSSTYEVSPFVNLSSVPGLANVPALGKPARIHFSAHRAVEHALNLGTTTAPPPVLSGGASQPLSSVTGLGDPGQLEDTTNSGWNYPNIYELIAASGQQIVQEEVLRVYARDDTWTDTRVNVDADTKVWIDYRADGLWEDERAKEVDASGYSYKTGTYGNGQNIQLADGLTVPKLAMIGKLDTSNSFLIGKQQWNMDPPGTGRLKLMCADKGDAFEPGYVDNVGSMIVRIIAVK
ncbi:MAG TPA: hypothetical protein V6D17_23665 [Candidatus Obscuribacterales bacterium]